MSYAEREPQTRQQAFEAAQREWLAEQFDGLTSEHEAVTPAEWSETRRYLPPSVTALPGPYSFDVTPYMREIVDCFGVDSSVRELALMKGVQITATTALENAIGYFIEHVKTAPVMLVTADDNLAQIRMTSYITPMLQHSGMMDLIKSTDEGNARKSGKTDKKLEWIGGGFLIPQGAKSAAGLRSVSVQVLLGDEVDGWPTSVGKDGDPVKLATDRTAAYETSRKLAWFSTPLVKGQSKIETLYLRGDQRKYFVKCLRCEHPQVLRWNRVDKDTGVVSGIAWEMDGGRLVPDSVRCLCEECGHAHTDADKPRLFAPDNAEWVPTAVPVSPEIRSYHLPALYSPAGMQSWAACVHKWLDAWDVEKHKPKDVEKLQVFYNNVLGEPFVVHGRRVKFERVSSHRRHAYHYGQVPNAFADEFCGGPVQVLTCAADVHGDNLKVAVFGWCVDRRAILIDYHTYEGNPERLDDPDTWGKLQTLIETTEYTADDGKRYRIELTLVDSGYLADTVYRFCEPYTAGVFPVKGTGVSPKSARVPEFTEFHTPTGATIFGITVDLYKDRWSAALQREWDGSSLQPGGHFNAPIDATDAQLKELTTEVKREKIDKETGQRLGFVWYRPSGAPNELWDLTVYNNAALDLLAWDATLQRTAKKDLNGTDWPAFWRECGEGRFYTEG